MWAFQTELCIPSFDRVGKKLSLFVLEGLTKQIHFSSESIAIADHDIDVVKRDFLDIPLQKLRTSCDVVIVFNVLGL